MDHFTIKANKNFIGIQTSWKTSLPIPTYALADVDQKINK